MSVRCHPHLQRCLFEPNVAPRCSPRPRLCAGGRAAMAVAGSPGRSQTTATRRSPGQRAAGHLPPHPRLAACPPHRPCQRNGGLAGQKIDQVKSLTIPIRQRNGGLTGPKFDQVKSLTIPIRQRYGGLAGQMFTTTVKVYNHRSKVYKAPPTIPIRQRFGGLGSRQAAEWALPGLLVATWCHRPPRQPLVPVVCLL